LALSYYIKGAR